MEELDELLTPTSPPAEPPTLRDAITRGVVRIQRQRRWLRRGQNVVILAACYAAGMATMWYLFPERPESKPEIVDRRADPPPPRVVDPYRNDSPQQMEKWAFAQTGAKRIELYRRAGDAYLGREDVQSALRCYRRALDSGSVADLAIQADSDSWLLMSLKMARKKERSDAHIN